jgi:hypothetical protein
MNRSSLLIGVIVATFVAAALTLAACSKGSPKGGLSGTYAATVPWAGTVTIEFKSRDEAFVSMNGQTKEGSYTVEGDKVIFQGAEGNIVYTIQKDGSLTSGSGDMSIVFKKK